MLRQEIILKYFNNIIELKGADELKETAKRLHIFLKNRENYSLAGVTLPNYLLIANRGGGITTVIEAFTEYLYALRAIEFCGMVKFFEFKLEYIHPDSFFSELTRLDKTIASFAGHNRYFKGIVGIDINEWSGHVHETHFSKLLDYISGNNDKMLVIFYIHKNKKNIIPSVESAISAQVRLESINLRFPDADELVDLVDVKYLQSKGFTLTADAKFILLETIEEIAKSKHFNGFKTIVRLASDILYNIFANDIKDKFICAEMLADYGKDSEYVKRAKAQIRNKKIIGFNERGA